MRSTSRRVSAWWSASTATRRSGSGADIELHRVDPEIERRQLERTARVRAERDAAVAAPSAGRGSAGLPRAPVTSSFRCARRSVSVAPSARSALSSARCSGPRARNEPRYERAQPQPLRRCRRDRGRAASCPWSPSQRRVATVIGTRPLRRRVSSATSRRFCGRNALVATSSAASPRSHSRLRGRPVSSRPRSPPRSRRTPCRRGRRDRLARLRRAGQADTERRRAQRRSSAGRAQAAAPAGPAPAGPRG